MTQPFRLARGGFIDRSRTIRFCFDGRDYQGHPGDTLASALLANGVRLVGRSFKYHRPRGIFSAGPEEPSALVQLERGAWTEPNRRATDVALYDGLVAASQHAWPDRRADFGAAIDGFASLVPAGFYYKTFLQPQAWRLLWEPLLRRMAGLGRAPRRPDPSRYDHINAHCDVLVVGGGPAGLAAALAAGQSGARVILAEHDRLLGGALLRRSYRVGDDDGATWAAAAASHLAAMPEVRLLPATTVLGRYDANYAIAAERVGDLLGPAAPAAMPRLRLWHIRARRIVLATGAIERPLAFPNNDRPGIMLASAVEAYAARYGVACGRRAVLFTNNDDAYATAAALAANGLEVAAVVDTRPEQGPAARAHAGAIPHYAGHAVVGTAGRRGLTKLWVRPLADASGPPTSIDCDLLAVSGGWNPAVHLFAHAQGRLRFDEPLGCFVPDGAGDGIGCSGAANGAFSLGACLAEGAAAGSHAAASCGFPQPDAPPIGSAEEVEEAPPAPLWLVPGSDGKRAFVDLHNDVTAADIDLAAREGFAAIEHVKRWTTLGMGTDQGKTGNITGLALLSAALGRTIAETGTTTFRPPYVAVPFGSLAGRARGRLADPVRATPMQSWHETAGAVFEPVGQWLRPRYYPRPGEDIAAAVRRECLAARDGVALLDASTLGKIEVCGPDAAVFLDRIYTVPIANLRIGRCRYGLMCREDGMVFDDGIVTRLGDDRFFLTTTTGNAAAVLDWLEEWLQTEWPELDVFVTSVSEEWANLTLVGPRSGAVLATLMPGRDLAAAAFPFMTVREGDIAGIRCRLFRVSFSGELSYEINVPAEYGLALWQVLLDAGAAHGIAAYGTEAMHVLRAEKGYMIVGQETDGSVTPRDLGLGPMLAPGKDFLGRRSLLRSEPQRADRKQLVGLLPEDPNQVLPEGAQLVSEPGRPPPGPMIGHVTSSYYGARIGRSFALALVKAGRDRHGATVWTPLGDRLVAARICAPVFYDPEGRRRDG